MKRDIDYVVKDGEVIIVDEFTGRLMLGRRYSRPAPGHRGQGARGRPAREPHARHDNLPELLPPLRQALRHDRHRPHRERGVPDHLRARHRRDTGRTSPSYARTTPTSYTRTRRKDRAIIKQIVECHEKGQPVLVGTVSIEKSEYLSKLLKREGVPHNVLNAKQHEREAEIVAQAGKFGRGHHRDEHGRPRHGHHARAGNAEYLARNRPQEGPAIPRRGHSRGDGLRRHGERGGPRRARALRRAHGGAQKGHRGRGPSASRPRAASSSSARSGTSRAV